MEEQSRFGVGLLAGCRGVASLALGGGGEASPGLLSSFVSDKVNQGMISRLVIGPPAEAPPA